MRERDSRSRCGSLEQSKSMTDHPNPTHRWRLPDGREVVTRGRFYAASCNGCGWAGSSEDCGIDTHSDDSDVYCPSCGAAGCDNGTLGEAAKEIANAE
jgi:hypothetical protein